MLKISTLALLMSCTNLTEVNLKIINSETYETNPRKIEKIIENLVLALRAIDSTTYTQEKVIEILNKIQELRFLDEWIDCTAIFGRPAACSGLYIPPGTIYVSYNECLPLSALTHELLHHFLYHTTGSPDNNHENLLYWSDDISVLSVTNKISCVEQCPNTCQIGDSEEEEEEKLLKIRLPAYRLR